MREEEKMTGRARERESERMRFGGQPEEKKRQEKIAASSNRRINMTKGFFFEFSRRAFVVRSLPLWSFQFSCCLLLTICIIIKFQLLMTSEELLLCSRKKRDRLLIYSHASTTRRIFRISSTCVLVIYSLAIEHLKWSLHFSSLCAQCCSPSRCLPIILCSANWPLWRPFASTSSASWPRTRWSWYSRCYSWTYRWSDGLFVLSQYHRRLGSLYHRYPIDCLHQ